MTEVTVKTDALKGKFTIRADEVKQDLFHAFGNKYVPFDIEATDLGMALNVFMQNTHRLKRTTDTQVRDAVRGAKIQATREANILAKHGLTPKLAQQDKKPSDLKDKKSA